MKEYIERYKRQITIKGIGPEGQKRLSSSSVCVIGCGGLGSTVIPNIAAAGVGRIILFDDDFISLSNLNRQILYKTKDLGEKKVHKAEIFIKELNPHVSVIASDIRVTPSTYKQVIPKVDLVVDCTDGLMTKFFLNDACVSLGLPLIHSAAVKSNGQILFIPPGGNPCLRCFVDEIVPGVFPSCKDQGILPSTCAVVGGLVANEIIKYLVSQQSSLIGKVMKFDLNTFNFNFYQINKNHACEMCGDQVTIDPECYEEYRKSVCHLEKESKAN
jgi:molybdopterin/thiamine biosynthesis adenylyltransferase